MRISDWSSDVCSSDLILGFARTPDLRGGFEDWIGRVHPEDVELARGAVNLCLTEGVPFNIEYRIFRADTGDERWLQSHRSEERRVGKESVSTGRSRGSP